MQSCSLVKASQQKDKRWLMRGEHTSTWMGEDRRVRQKGQRWLHCWPSWPSVQTLTCLLASRRAAAPTSWKQSAATGVDVRNLSTMFTARQQHSKDKRKYLCREMSQLTSVHRASEVSCKQK